MVKVIVASLKPSPKGGRSTVAVTKKRVRDTEGQIKTLRTLDAASATFGDDFQYVFGRNVAKARKDNKRTAGVTDAAVAKR
ncbi:hypothetical protein QO010_000022 [Caulobacter ginsengisoli]|jgi:hypothetical protein|uniref:Uncharacterized protein n=1 Tax=Caulobacter ginsengisoli TaxID=400775 RepID=A0ABU0IK10_9CAUL|nr:hypothetical protein [Caulobacter ginsengisoli]MDQ0462274.1 hypothetical protein [Caulobacter ginsengisoli]